MMFIYLFFKFAIGSPSYVGRSRRNCTVITICADFIMQVQKHRVLALL